MCLHGASEVPERTTSLLCRCFVCFALTAFFLTCGLARMCQCNSAGGALAGEENAIIMDFPEEEKNRVAMPELKTMTSRAALEKVKQLGITKWIIVPVPSKEPQDSVIEQAPPPGTRINSEKARVTLYIAAPIEKTAHAAPEAAQPTRKERKKTSAALTWTLFICSQLLTATAAVSLLRKTAPARINSGEVKITLTPVKKKAKKKMLEALQSNFEEYKTALSSRRRKQEKEDAHAADRISEEKGEADDSAPFPCMPVPAGDESSAGGGLSTSAAPGKGSTGWHSELSRELREEDFEIVEMKTTALLRFFAGRLDRVKTEEEARALTQSSQSEDTEVAENTAG